MCVFAGNQKEIHHFDTHGTMLEGKATQPPAFRAFDSWRGGNPTPMNVVGMDEAR